MNNMLKSMALAITLAALPIVGQAKQWTLQECIDYALQNNITLQKSRLQTQSADRKSVV